MTNQEQNDAVGKCEWIKASGKGCQANAMAGSRFCWFHDPKKTGDRARARRQGGLQRGKQVAVVSPDVPQVRLKRFRDVTRLLALTINQVRRGQTTSRVANTIGYLASVFFTCQEKVELDERLTALEKRVFKVKHQ